jgi:hypothetical protein
MLYLPYFYNICILLKIPSHNTPEVQNHIPLCALLSSHPNFHVTGKWYFDDCEKESYGFVCEKMQGKKYLGVCSSHFLVFHICFMQLYSKWFHSLQYEAPILCLHIYVITLISTSPVLCLLVVF